MKPGVYITVDVECSMGGAWHSPSLKPVPPSRAVMGEYGNRRLGLPLIADILSSTNLSATFFVEVFMAEQGYEGHGETICQYLLDGGQDVQLHVHPNHKHWGLKRQGLPYSFTDSMAEVSPEERLALLNEGCRRMRRWTGRRPVAFRAGNMAGSESVLEQVARAGIRIDSSYTFPYAGSQCGFSRNNPYNGSRWYGDVLELAVSGFTIRKFPGLKPAKPLDLMGISFEECREAIWKICESGADAVVILHSFRFFKFRNVQYDGGRPNRIVARRFRRLCEWLAVHKERFPTYTFSELSRAIAEGKYTAKAVPPCRLSRVRAVMRKTVQAVNSIYWI